MTVVVEALPPFNSLTNLQNHTESPEMGPYQTQMILLKECSDYSDVETAAIFSASIDRLIIHVMSDAVMLDALSRLV